MSSSIPGFFLPGRCNPLSCRLTLSPELCHLLSTDTGSWHYDTRRGSWRLGKAGCVNPRSPASAGHGSTFGVDIRTDSRFAPSQWETSLQSNAVSHWLGANLESALDMVISNYLSNRKLQRCNRWSWWMKTQFYPTICWACDYLSTLDIKLIHISNRALVTRVTGSITKNRAK